MSDEMVFDYVIVGAGSSGSVIANRLSSDPSVKVCLIEAGGSDASQRVQTPAGTITLYKSKTFSWNFFSVPQKGLNGRRLHTPRGKALGGSASMNSMIYIRGDASDYDHWESLGCRGWGWRDVLPYFKKSEKNMIGQSRDYHGTDGELLVDRARDPNPFSRMFVDAAKNAGVPENPDFNGSRLEGCGIYDLTQTNGRRLSSYRAFIHPVLDKRENLHVMTDCEIDEVLMEGKVAKGVTLRSQGKVATIRVNHEVILCAGTLGSPVILLRSGIGPEETLSGAGVGVRHHLPGVGKNLQDHLDGLVTVRSKSPKTLGFSLGSLPKVLASPWQYIFKRKGWLSTNYVEAGGFARVSSDSQLPDVQFHFVPGYRSHRGRLFEWGHGYAVHTCVLKPKSIGEVRLNADKELELDFNFLSDEEDARVLIEGIRLARQILADPLFAPYRGKEMLPGEKVQSDEQLLAYIRDYAATVFHPVGTCKMGEDDMAVVTPELRVRGIEGLRVADASVIPSIVRGNTNAPSIMIGEKAADMIRSDAL